MNTNHVHHSVAVITLALLSLVAIPGYADQPTAQASFEAGIEAYNAGQYELALDRYADSLANGKSSSRLYYNIGLAHYKLDHFAQAEQAFKESLQDPELRAVSYYNLGLVAKGRGSRSEAINNFERARQLAKSDALRKNSEKALGILGVARYASQSNRRLSSARQTEFLWDFSARVGYDDNAYRSPSTPYIDVSQVLMPLVTPNEQSGMYIPLRLGANYRNPVGKKSTFVWSYDYRGDLYVDSNLENANISNHKFAIGGERMLGNSGSERRRLAYSLLAARHIQTNFDRDNGLDRFDTGQSISDRFKYTSVGAQADVQNRIGKNWLDIGGGYENRNYDSVPTAADYDLDMYWVNGDVRFALSPDTRLKVGFEYRARNYDQRRAHDALGVATSANAFLEYRYQTYEVSFRHRFSDRFLAQLAYYRTNRSDEFVGYNDYDQDKFRLTTRFLMSDRLTTNLRFTYRDQSYPNAFAFDIPTQAQKSYDEFEVYATTEYQLRDHFYIYGEVRFQDIGSSDPRGEYQRSRGAIGVSWEY